MSVEKLKATAKERQDTGQFDQAADLLRQVLKETPKDTETRLSFVRVLRHLGESAEAIAQCEQILSDQPEHARAFVEIGNILYDQSIIDSSLKYYNMAIRADNQLAEAHVRRARALLLNGDYPDGWQAHEWRFKVTGTDKPYPHQLKGRLWDGSPYGGERLLVHCEQDMSDVLQLCRYLPMVKALGGHLILEAHDQLTPLLQRLPAVDEVIAFDAAKPPAVRYDQHIALLSIPLLMRTTLDRIPAQIPYIQADPTKAAQWRRRLTGEGLCVGLVWAKNDRAPVQPLEIAQCATWWSNNNFRFYSLQTGTATKSLDTLGSDQPIVQLGQDISDFSDTAAIIANLDLIISVDASVVHLAGAMGKPVWVLLPAVPDWRWLMSRTDSPWYPTARLFRQMQGGDWSSVIADIDAALAELAGKTTASPQHSMEQASIGQSDDQDQFQTRFNQGLAYLDAAEYQPAIRSFQQAIAAHPQWAEAHFELGRAYHGQGQIPQAIEAYQTACRLKPELKPAHANLGLAYFQIDQLDQASASYEAAIRLHSDLAPVLTNLGVVKEAQQDPDGAVDCYHSALRIDPNHADALYNLGNIHLTRRQLREAEQCYTRALRINPHHAKAHGNLGRTYHLMGLLDQALACFNEALALQPDEPDAHLNRALTRLLVGQWRSGWRDYEWRFRCRNRYHIYPHELYGERWSGEDFKGRTLLVHSEQEIGDAIQFARYLPLVKERGGRVIFETHRSLRHLFTNLSGVDELAILSTDAPPSQHYHTYIPLCSLPGIFNTVPGNVPNEVPYLHHDVQKAEHWRHRLPAEGLNVGLVWGENETAKGRNCTLADMVPLALVKGINWIGLQKGPSSAQANPEHLPYNFKVTNWGEAFEDFSDAAAAVSCLDLVISVDTAAAHLAGAMGKPVWILLPAVPDWRWMLERSKTPWYPTAHLFRQSLDGTWNRVMAHMSASLEQWRKTQ